MAGEIPFEDRYYGDDSLNVVWRVVCQPVLPSGVDINMVKQSLLNSRLLQQGF